MKGFNVMNVVIYLQVHEERILSTAMDTTVNKDKEITHKLWKNTGRSLKAWTSLASGKMLFLGALCLISLFAFTRAGEICCEDIGCFTDDPPYDHYRLPRCPEDIPTSFELFTRDNNDGEDFKRNEIPNNYHLDKRTILLIHGYMNDRNSDYLFHLKDAILTLEDVNVIIVGWGGILDYPVAASSTRTVGSEAAFMVDNLVAHGASYGNMWCVGFSLGAHTCGHVGMRSKGTFGRVTGLDPAGPWFENYDHSTGINPGAAAFVDIIHTMAHNPIVNWGILRPVGHIDFYPNGGEWLQPGCITYYKSSKEALDALGNMTTPEDFMDFDTACSHGRSVDYFLESILNDCFIARQSCTEEVDKIPKNCADCNGGAPCAHMGYHAQGSGPNGIYYLETNYNDPFCRN